MKGKHIFVDEASSFLSKNKCIAFKEYITSVVGNKQFDKRGGHRI